MKKYAVLLLCLLILCGCSYKNNNQEERVQSKEKPIRITALYYGLGENREKIDDKASIGVWVYYPDQTKEFLKESWTIQKPIRLEYGKTKDVTIEYQGLKSTIAIECSEPKEKQFKKECSSPDQSDLEVTFSSWYGKKLTYSGIVKYREKIKQDQVYVIGIFNDTFDVYILDYGQKFDYKINDSVQFWGYGLGRTVVEKKFSEDENLIVFKGKYMEKV